jgi:hypothetical protein
MVLVDPIPTGSSFSRRISVKHLVDRVCFCAESPSSRNEDTATVR